MPDELDRDLKRRFAALESTLPAEPFVTELLRQLEAPRQRAQVLATLKRLPGLIGSALWVGVGAPLRLQYAGGLAAVTAALALWTAFA